MQLEKPMKHVIIEIHFRYMRDFRMTMTNLKNQITSGVQESKGTLPHLKFEHGLCYLKEFDYKEETIDGKECVVIASKMNKGVKKKPINKLGVIFTLDYEKRNQLPI